MLYNIQQTYINAISRYIFIRCSLRKLMTWFRIPNIPEWQRWLTWLMSSCTLVRSAVSLGFLLRLTEDLSKKNDATVLFLKNCKLTTFMARHTIWGINIPVWNYIWFLKRKHIKKIYGHQVDVYILRIPQISKILTSFVNKNLIWRMWPEMT